MQLFSYSTLDESVHISSYAKQILAERHHLRPDHADHSRPRDHRLVDVLEYDGKSDSCNLMPKVNVGYRAGRFILTAYIMTLTEEYADFLEYNYIGATIGFRF